MTLNEATEAVSTELGAVEVGCVRCGAIGIPLVGHEDTCIGDYYVPIEEPYRYATGEAVD